METMMVGSIGLIALLTSLGISFVQVFTPFCKKKYIENSTICLFFLIAISISFMSLIYSFAISDFSIENVYKNSHNLKPFIYKISASWGNHEGSLLLLCLILAIYNYFFAKLSKSQQKYNNIVLSVQSFIASGFLTFIIFTSNPFVRLSPVPIEGLGLNPLLQDIGLAIHPPILYIGYIGLSFTLSFAIAALLLKELDKVQITLIKQFTLFSWSFLTLGIALGSWWAYRELGWGGFWFWDPVENVSLMPWLSATAFLHSLIVTEKSESLKSWTLLLSITTFILTLIGIFLVRSGILTSVHSFASDPTRGLYILIFLSIISLFSYGLFALNGHHIKSKNNFNPISKESGILLNNIFLMICCFVVLMGTIYPIIAQIFGEYLSVGAPYFNKIFNPLALPLIVLASIVPLISWKYDKISRVKKLISLPSFITIFIFGFILFVPEKKSFIGAIALSISSMLITSMIQMAYKNRSNLKISLISMVMAHIGLAILVIGITVTSIWGLEKEQLLQKNQFISIDRYVIRYESVFIESRKNYISKFGKFTLYNYENKELAKLKPEVRFYPVERNTTTESDIYYTLFSNIYIVIGDVTKEGAIVTRIYYKPFINLIWFGSLIMFIGGLLGLINRGKK